eukprot:gene9478-14715_t
MAREHVEGEDRALSVLRLRNACRLEYLRYEHASGSDAEQCIEAHEKVNKFMEWWWRSWQDPIEKPAFKKEWAAETKHMDETQAKAHYAKLLTQRIEGMREFNAFVDQALSARPPVPAGPGQQSAPDWRTP